MPILHLPSNTSGRDFVVGDVHGQYDHLQKLLEHVGFDQAADRCIGVGDLGDRGPKSVEVWDLFRKPGFYSAKGNHDEMLEMVINARLFPWRPCFSSSLYSRNGGSWALQMLAKKSPADTLWLRQLYPHLEKMPLAIVVGAGTPKRYNVVNTEFLHPPGLDEDVTDDHIDSWDFKAQGLYIQDGGGFLWDRRIIETRLAKRQGRKMSITYSGHTPLKCGRPVQIGRQILLDTGAGYMDNPDLFLSMIEAGTRKAYRINNGGKVSTATVKKITS